jgi:hypothetical protein
MIKAIDAAGNVFWYTGKAGQEWVSPNQADAWNDYTLEYARHRAAQFNRMSSVHGLYFLAVVPNSEFAIR